VSIRLRRTDGPAPARPVYDEHLYRQCRAGFEPAELLTTGARGQLVHELWTLGWTDVEVAVHTRMSTYTAAAIRTRLGLSCRPPAGAAA
jgi:hypothetical protein